jgi:hypothetical protein
VVELNTAIRQAAGAGTQTAGLKAGGQSSNNTTEEYNGFAWSPGGNLGTGRSL